VSALLLAILLALALGLAVAAIRTRDLLGAALVLGGYGLVLSLIWAAMGAVDVAFTEAVVGAGVSTVLFLAALLQTSAQRTTPRPRARWGAAAAAGTLAAALLWAAPDLPRFGDPGTPPGAHVSPRYLEAGLGETGAPNIVTAVLADYRGYDTLVETVVIVTAGLACWLLLARAGGRP
jgi:multicomponent Na+:H+ antiporter subunit B